jgi:hypothetical protein
MNSIRMKNNKGKQNIGEEKAKKPRNNLVCNPVFQAARRTRAAARRISG